VLKRDVKLQLTVCSKHWKHF